MLFFLLVVDCKTLFVTFICFHCKSLVSVLALFSCVLGFLLFLITVLNWRRDAERCEPFIGGQGGEVFMSTVRIFFPENFFIFIGIHLFCLIIGGFLDCCQIRNGLFVTMFWRFISDSFVLRFCLLKGYLYCCN